MTKKWFQIGLASIFLFSLALRFWGLGRFNTLVFDEIYYAKFGNNYLSHVPFFDGHPPLGKYMIAVGIWVGSHVPFWQDTVNGLTGSLLSPWSYRWINAFSGSFIPLIIASIAYQLSYRHSFALLAGFFTACDGIFIVESRYALINIYIVLFGLLGQWLFLLALANQRQRPIYLVLAGIGFGASVATKWNGLFFLLGIYLIWIIGWIWQWIIKAKSQAKDVIDDLSASLTRNSTITLIRYQQTNAQISLLQNLTQINIWQIVFFLGIIPLAVYSLIWIPHLQLDTKYGFLEVHQQILAFHERLGGNNAKVHPYCAAWYKWPLMNRPMAYYYQTTQSVTDPLPVFGPALPAGVGKVIYDVHAMGNPFLWWFGAAAILFLIGMLIIQLVIPWVKQKRFSLPTKLSIDTWIALYLVVNYAVNLVPWMKVTRCVFIYHYMTAVVFAFLAIAWFVDQCFRSYYRPLRALGITISFLILLAFVFWMPIYLGLPLSSGGYKVRMWFNSWI
ncbi:dolichyl-phosphate-mannose--protein mannosyltransferase [Dendronalium sp. ChiSLP03b]|uniref:dolichyl-phosphate-mannose--protein mannosyltransferase n=1 Tax=Dendronalium sp. ChiSLP03b TaxID=3075381 RepID=UPI002AD3014D|nr:phospholipid carrier-dependent glycosyltransferase [Dendronalium sp. ChiSLP03b]MDZ8207707.1 phospholipid carrier-dependent glycosyltransferase [Dendronalium sp. ChiSLP03b]